MTKLGYLIFFILSSTVFCGVQIFVFNKETSIELVLISLFVGILTPLLIMAITKIRKKDLTKN